MLPRSKALRALLTYLVLLALACAALVVLLACGWWPASPSDVAGLGATPERCRAAFGAAWDVQNGSGWDSAKNLGYVKGAWMIYVGFNEAGRTEQFIFCKFKAPLLPSARLSTSERQTLLARFKDGSTWSTEEVADYGLNWQRADLNAFASYNTSNRWFIVMDWPCLQRKFRSLPGHENDVLVKPGVTQP